MIIENGTDYPLAGSDPDSDAPVQRRLMLNGLARAANADYIPPAIKSQVAYLYKKNLPNSYNITKISLKS